jgi:hypothetical protein
LHARASVRVIGASPNQSPGFVIDTSAGRDTAAIHVFDRFRRRPRGVGRLQQRAALDRRHPGGWREVMVDVDTVRPHGRRALAASGVHQRRARTGRGE